MPRGQEEEGGDDGGVDGEDGFARGRSAGRALFQPTPPPAAG